jgi:hypothetical protein
MLLETSFGPIPAIISFTGISPVLCNNSKAILNQGAAGVVLFYLKDGTQIFIRLGAEQFRNEYVLNPTLPAPLAILIKAEILQIGGTFYQLIWAETTDGRFVFLKSAVFPALVTDGLLPDTTLEGSSYFVPVSTPTMSDSMTEDTTLQGSGFILTVVPGSDSDALTEDATIQSGSYVNAVVSEPSSDSITSNTTIESGSYA